MHTYGKALIVPTLSPSDHSIISQQVGIDYVPERVVVMRNQGQVTAPSLWELTFSVTDVKWQGFLVSDNLSEKDIYFFKCIIYI